MRAEPKSTCMLPPEETPAKFNRYVMQKLAKNWVFQACCKPCQEASLFEILVYAALKPCSSVSANPSYITGLGSSLRVAVSGLPLGLVMVTHGVNFVSSISLISLFTCLWSYA